MTMVSQVTTWRAHPGSGMELLTNCAEAKQIHIRAGADQVWISQTFSGANSGTITYMLVFESAQKWGQFADSLASNQEWQTFWSKISSKPSADLVDTSLYFNTGL